MKVNFKYILSLSLSIFFVACQPSLDDKIDLKNYEADLKSLVNENEHTDILRHYDEKHRISTVEYKEMIDYLSEADTLDFVQKFTYKGILFRVKHHIAIREEQEKEKKLERIAFKTQNVTIYFRDTPEEIERKIQKDADSELYTFYIIDGEKDYRMLLGESKPHFSFNTNYGDEKERLDFLAITLDLHSASTYEYYYVGATKKAFDRIIEYFKNQYGEIEYYYPRLSSYGAGYGNRFAVAEWNVRNTYIRIEMYEEKELWDLYGYDSYKTKYVVQATICNFDENLKVAEGE